jgi:predicted ester cyclase
MSPDCLADLKIVLVEDHDDARRGDSLAFAYTLTGTHNGPLGKIPPTGKKVKIRGVQISKFKDGKMVERWGSSDELTLLKQIGVIPA